MSDEEGMIVGGKSESFMSYLTTITPVEKNELLNVFQYVLLVVIPLVLFLKFMKEYIPPENPTKSTIETTTEVVIQLLLIFVVFWIIHKVVLYIPTYSNTPYEKLNMIQMVLPVLFLLFCMKSSISEKLSILLERGLIVLGMKTEGMEEPKKNESPRTGPSQGPPNPTMYTGQMGMGPTLPMNTTSETTGPVQPQFGIDTGPMPASEMGYGGMY